MASVFFADTKRAVFWLWDTGGPRDRANAVRHHFWTEHLSHEQVRELFELTTEGLDMILRGDNWRPEYERPDG
jgi:hypothetical protein